MSLFGKKAACGCAEEGGEVFFVSLNYDAVGRRIDLLSAVYGREDDVGLVKALVRRHGTKPVWVPVKVATIAQLSDVRISRIDDGDGLVRGSDLQHAMESQMKQLEADKKGDYLRTLSCAEQGGRRRWIGGSIPRPVVEETFEAWRKRGFSKPCVASRHIALVNLFLALHGEAGKSDGRNRILVGWQTGVDIFCYLKGDALIDCGSSAMTSDPTFEQHMEALGAWAGDFAKKHKVSEKDGFRAIVATASLNACPEDFQPDENLSFWTPSWGKSVRFATPSVETAVTTHPELAMRAIGLALHGA